MFQPHNGMERQERQYSGIIFRGWGVLILTGTPTTLDEPFHGFSQSLEYNISNYVMPTCLVIPTAALTEL
jgi:hypothetical protein